MKPTIYINGIGNISPQDTFDQPIGTELVQAESAFFVCQEPAYKTFIKRKLLRRMSRVVRMGLAASYKALEQAENPTIDAIVTGTAWGCVKDTEKFLETIIENNEEYLTPTAFVQSTHNTVGGQIALMHHNNCYNMTYVQGNVSFESALLDALLLLWDQKASNLLVGGIDEQTDQLKVLLQRLGCANTTERVMGEGAAFFVLSTDKNTTTKAQLAGAQMLYKPNEAAVQKNIQTLLNAAGVDSLDLVLTGVTNKTILENTSHCTYKQLCGEYPTSSSFAMALAANLVQGDVATQQALNLEGEAPKHVLIYNEDAVHTSMILIAKA